MMNSLIEFFLDVYRGLRYNTTGETFANADFISKLDSKSPEERWAILKKLYDIE